MPLVDLTNDDEAGPSGAVKDEPTDEAGERSKQDVVHDGMDNFHQYHYSHGRRKYHDSDVTFSHDHFDILYFF
jgi:hypothetical protein